MKFFKPVVGIVAPSIALLMHLGLVTAEFPVVWKPAVIFPIFKHGSKDDIANYRPISLLPLLSQILDKAACYQVMKYFQGNSIIYKSFHGYRTFNSTKTVLIKIADDILKTYTVCWYYNTLVQHEKAATFPTY